MINAETACRIQEAVDLKKPFIDKDMTVGGKLMGNDAEQMIQVFLDVPIGTPVADMFEKAGGCENHGIAKDCGELGLWADHLPEHASHGRTSLSRRQADFLPASAFRKVRKKSDCWYVPAVQIKCGWNSLQKVLVPRWWASSIANRHWK